MEADRRTPYSQWTVDTVAEHWEMVLKLAQQRTDDRFAAMEEATKMALHSAQTAVDKAERLADVRAEVQDRLAAERSRQQNEWRETVNDISTRMLSRAEYEIAHKTLVERLDGISSRLDRQEGGKQQTDTIVPWVIAAAGTVITAIALLIEFTH